MSVDPMQAAARGAVTDQEMPSPEMLYVTILGSLRIRRGDSTLGGSELGGP